jgi:hypothetical protein
MKRTFIVLLTCVCYSISSAQEIITPRQQAEFITRFHFRQYSGGVMVVHGMIDGIPDSLNFILDTGSGGISLDSATCAKNNIIPSNSDTMVTGMGSAHKAKFIYKYSYQFFIP